MTGRRVYNVLFLCTGNSARSIMAETLLERLEALDRLALERKVEELGHLRIVPSGEPAR